MIFVGCLIMIGLCYQCQKRGFNLTQLPGMDGCQLDIKIKTGIYIQKVVQINQEFHFAHPSTKIHLNKIYNGHFTGLKIWELGSREAEKLESAYNRSVKIMFNLPFSTHRYLIEPMTNMQHPKKILMKRYLSFIKSIEGSPKKSLRELLNIVKNDTRSNTGCNLRQIMLNLGLNNISEVESPMVDQYMYHPIQDDDMWRVPFLEEMINVFSSDLEVPGFEMEEINSMLNYICTT